MDVFVYFQKKQAGHLLLLPLYIRARKLAAEKPQSPREQEVNLQFQVQTLSLLVAMLSKLPVAERYVYEEGRRKMSLEDAQRALVRAESNLSLVCRERVRTERKVDDEFVATNDDNLEYEREWEYDFQWEKGIHEEGEERVIELLVKERFYHLATQLAKQASISCVQIAALFAAKWISFKKLPQTTSLTYLEKLNELEHACEELFLEDVTGSALCAFVEILLKDNIAMAIPEVVKRSVKVFGMNGKSVITPFVSILLQFGRVEDGMEMVRNHNNNNNNNNSFVVKYDG